MCTVIAIKQKSKFFGRNLDLEHRFNEEAVITPRNFELKFRHAPSQKKHYAIIGIATLKNSYPLYYDAINEHGLAMAGLNFIGNARFQNANNNCHNIAQFELIPFILGNCKDLQEAKEMLKATRLVSTPFDEETPVSDLHYFITDGDKSLAVEPNEKELSVYEDSFGILTNNPPFPYHEANINNYMSLSSETPENKFSHELDLKAYSRGMGALGLPGDLSSASRFIRAAFTKENALRKENSNDEISQVFHILNSVFQTEGLCKVGNLFEKTQYSAVANLDTLTYYYKTYTCSRIRAVRLGDIDAEAEHLIRFPLIFDEDIFFEN